jgi:hypothetical protein
MKELPPLRRVSYLFEWGWVQDDTPRGMRVEVIVNGPVAALSVSTLTGSEDVLLATRLASRMCRVDQYR